MSGVARTAGPRLVGPMFRRTVLVALALSTSPGTTHADSGALASMPRPPGTQSLTIATDLVRNGLSTSIASLDTSAAADETLAYYRETWPAVDTDPGHAEARLGDWSVISRMAGDTLLVVQVRDGATGPEGLLSAMSPTRATGVTLPPPPLPAGGELLSSLNTRDAGHVAVTSIISARARPGEIAAFYRDRLTRDGWRLASDRIDDGSVVLLFDRDGSRLELVVSEVDGQSVVVVNEVRLDV